MDHPKLRPIEAFAVVVNQQQMICLQDPLKINDMPLIVNGATYFLLTLMDGTRDILDIKADFARRTGEILVQEKLDGLISQLDAAYLLDNDRYRQHYSAIQEEFLSLDARPIRHAGTSYPADAEELRAALDEMIGRFEKTEDDLGADPPVGLIAPHIDFQRGANVYASAYGTLREWANDVDLYVILGTCHHGVDRGFALTRKDYETPLGIAQTDRDFLNRLADRCPSDWFGEEFAHRDEHSIEFQTIWLRYLVSPDRPVRIVPILCGFFARCMTEGCTPKDDEDVDSFCVALRETIAETEGRVCVVAGVDLSHIGGRFGGNQRMTPGFLADLERRDRATMGFVERVDAEGFYRDVVDDDDVRNICGLSALYVLLRVTEANEGRTLAYEQTVDQQTQSVVSFAAGVLLE